MVTGERSGISGFQKVHASVEVRPRVNLIRQVDRATESNDVDSLVSLLREVTDGLAGRKRTKDGENAAHCIWAFKRINGPLDPDQSQTLRALLANTLREYSGRLPERARASALSQVIDLSSPNQYPDARRLLKAVRGSLTLAGRVRVARQMDPFIYASMRKDIFSDIARSPKQIRSENMAREELPRPGDMFVLDRQRLVGRDLETLIMGSSWDEFSLIFFSNIGRYIYFQGDRNQAMPSAEQRDFHQENYFHKVVDLHTHPTGSEGPYPSPDDYGYFRRNHETRYLIFGASISQGENYYAYHGSFFHQYDWRGQQVGDRLDYIQAARTMNDSVRTSRSPLCVGKVENSIS